MALRAILDTLTLRSGRPVEHGVRRRDDCTPRSPVLVIAGAGPKDIRWHIVAQKNLGPADRHQTVPYPSRFL